MNEEEMQNWLREAIENHSEGNETFAAVRSYEEAGVLTNNAGLVLRMPDGREFQLTIVRSR